VLLFLISTQGRKRSPVRRSPPGEKERTSHSNETTKNQEKKRRTLRSVFTSYRKEGEKGEGRSQIGEPLEDARREKERKRLATLPSLTATGRRENSTGLKTVGRPPPRDGERRECGAGRAPFLRGEKSEEDRLSQKQRCASDAGKKRRQRSLPTLIDMKKEGQAPSIALVGEKKVGDLCHIEKKRAAEPEGR